MHAWSHNFCQSFHGSFMDLKGYISKHHLTGWRRKGVKADAPSWHETMAQ